MKDEELFSTIEKVVDSVREWRKLPDWERDNHEYYILGIAVGDILEAVDNYLDGGLYRPWESL